MNTDKFTLAKIDSNNSKIVKPLDGDYSSYIASVYIDGIISYIFLYQKIRYMITFEKDNVEKRLKMTISTVEMENELVV